MITVADTNNFDIREQILCGLLVFSMAMAINGQFLYFWILEITGIAGNSVLTGAYFIIICGAVIYLSLIANSTTNKRQFRIQIADIAVAGFYTLVYLNFVFEQNMNDYSLLPYFIVFGPVAYITGRSFPVRFLPLLLKAIVALGVLSLLAAIQTIVQLGFEFHQGRFRIPASQNAILTGVTFSIFCFAQINHYLSNQCRFQKPPRFAPMWLMIAGLSMLIMLLAAAKQAVIGLGIALLYLFIKWRFARTNGVIVSALLMCVGIVTLVIYSDVLRTLITVFTTLLNSQSTRGRLEVYESAWQSFIADPTTGAGPSSVLYAHNFFLDAAGTLGIVGFLLALLIVVPVVGRILMMRTHTPDYRILGCLFTYGVLLIFLLSAMVSGALHLYFSLFLALGMSVSALENRDGMFGIPRYRY